ncbi:S-layer homology domain-containing protein [Virgibacillus sp. LDC1]|nr:S-layer homology domain-containing protein [Virgibacillus sp. LDC1]
MLAAKGLINGITDKEYQPQTPIRRADFLILLVETFELHVDDGSPGTSFADVPEHVYYGRAAGIARALGIVQGDGSNRFLPSSPITREEAAVMIHRAMQVIDMPSNAESGSALPEFKDAGAIQAYAREAVDILMHARMLQGANGYFHPEKTLTRAETAVLLYRLYNLLPSYM